MLALGLFACDTRVDGDDGAIRGPDAASGFDAGPPPPDTGAIREVIGRCDMRTAGRAYAAAHSANPADPETALGYALTDLLLLGEDPEADAALRLWGFSGGIDSEVLLWGPGGLLDSLNRHTSSREYGDFIEARFPSDTVRGADAWDSISPATTGADVLAHGLAMQPRFARLAAAFETAASGAPHRITIDGLCGIGEVELQAAELYLLAAVWQSVVLALEIGRGYSWDFPLQDGFGQGLGTRAERLGRQVDVLNTHLGAVRDASVLPGIRAEWTRFFALMDRALQAADEAGAPGASALTEWRAFRSGLLPAMREQGTAASGLADGTVTAPGLTPAWSGELAPLFEGELDLADFGRTFSLYEDPMWGDVWIEVDEAPIDAVLMAVLSLSPFDDARGDVDWAHLDAWRGTRAEWQLTEVDSERVGQFPVDVPRFVSDAVARYRDRWYFESR